jgi:hypothetical protein
MHTDRNSGLEICLEFITNFTLLYWETRRPVPNLFGPAPLGVLNRKESKRGLYRKRIKRIRFFLGESDGEK